VSSGKFQQRRANWKDDNFILEVKAEKLKSRKRKNRNPKKLFSLLSGSLSLACRRNFFEENKIPFFVFFNFNLVQTDLCKGLV
jgi:hypothetical protein